MNGTGKFLKNSGEVSAGDVLNCTKASNVSSFSVGSKYLVYHENGYLKIRDDVGNMISLTLLNVTEFEVFHPQDEVDLSNPDKLPLKDCSPEFIKALISLDKKDVEVFGAAKWFSAALGPNFSSTAIYRKKSEVKEVYLYSEDGILWSEGQNKNCKFEMTYTLIEDEISNQVVKKIGA